MKADWISGSLPRRASCHPGTPGQAIIEQEANPLCGFICYNGLSHNDTERENSVFNVECF